MGWINGQSLSLMVRRSDDALTLSLTSLLLCLLHSISLNTHSYTHHILIRSFAHSQTIASFLLIASDSAVKSEVPRARFSEPTAVESPRAF